jgi:hypothetical protein
LNEKIHALHLTQRRKGAKNFTKTFLAASRLCAFAPLH